MYYIFIGQTVNASVQKLERTVVHSTYHIHTHQHFTAVKMVMATNSLADWTHRNEFKAKPYTQTVIFSCYSLIIIRL